MTKRSPQSRPDILHRTLRYLRLFGMGVVLLTALAVGLMLATSVRIGLDVQRLIGKPACMPSLVYLWKRTDMQPVVGDYVVAHMPATGDTQIGARPGDRIVKKVAALGGEHVRIQGTELFINGVHKDRLWLAKSLPGKKVGDFDIDLKLSDGELFLMGTTQESYDSRYWGTVKREAIIGYAYPLF